MTRERNRWMSCARSVDWHTSRHRHLVRVSTTRWDRGWADTLCGATGTPGTFRRSNTKPPCPACCAAAGIAIPSLGIAPTERGGTMPTTTKKARTKHDTPPKASTRKHPAEMTPEERKKSARTYAARAAKKGGNWTEAYIKAWRRLSGLPQQRSPVA